MTTENNKLIVEFLKAPYYKQYEEYELYGILDIIKDGKNQQHFFKLEDMLFNSDWNWLMKVVEKIENIDKTEVQIFGDFRGYYLCYIRQYSDNKSPKDIRIETKSKIETVYNACLAFIEWYNENAVKELKTKENEQ